MAVEVLNTQRDTQRALVQKLESLIDDQLSTRDKMRNALVGATLAENMVPEMRGAIKVLSFGVDPGDSVRAFDG